MSNANMFAMLGMCAIVITLYAMKESHTHYLPDLFGLVLALAAPRPSYAVGCVLVLAIVRHSRLAHGLSESVPSWLLLVALPGALNMSRLEDDYSQAESTYKNRISEENDTHEMGETSQQVGETREELICFGETLALARLVVAEQIKLTEAVKIGAAAKSGPKYQKRSREVKEQIEAIRNHYPAGSNLKQFK